MCAGVRASRHAFPSHNIQTINSKLVSLYINIRHYYTASLVCSSLRSERSGKLLLNFCVSAILFNVFFICSSQAVHFRVGACALVTSAVHYSLLATCLWILMTALNIHEMLGTVFITYESHFLLKRCIVAWGESRDQWPVFYQERYLKNWPPPVPLFTFIVSFMLIVFVMPINYISIGPQSIGVITQIEFFKLNCIYRYSIVDRRHNDGGGFDGLRNSGEVVSILHRSTIKIVDCIHVKLFFLNV